MGRPFLSKQFSHHYSVKTSENSTLQHSDFGMAGLFLIKLIHAVYDIVVRRP